MENKKHWYDGWIYDRIIAPNQEGIFTRIKDLISPGSDVVDIGCGTGSLAFMLAHESRFVLGIDLSERNISTAGKNLQWHGFKNIAFRHSGLSETVAEEKRHFDYAILSFVIHEVEREGRAKLLHDASSIAEKVIVCDHLPRTRPFTAFSREIIEFFAGIKHYMNFRNFIAGEGIKTPVAEAGLKIIHEEVFKSTLHIIIISKT